MWRRRTAAAHGCPSCTVSSGKSALPAAGGGMRGGAGRPPGAGVQDRQHPEAKPPFSDRGVVFVAAKWRAPLYEYSPETEVFGSAGIAPGSGQPDICAQCDGCRHRAPAASAPAEHLHLAGVPSLTDGNVTGENAEEFRAAAQLEGLRGRGRAGRAKERCSVSCRIAREGQLTDSAPIPSGAAASQPDAGVCCQGQAGTRDVAQEGDFHAELAASDGQGVLCMGRLCRQDDADPPPAHGQRTARPGRPLSVQQCPWQGLEGSEEHRDVPQVRLGHAGCAGGCPGRSGTDAGHRRPVRVRRHVLLCEQFQGLPPTTGVRG
mmetsp:Transcript_23324/g.58544  ORF Transcript_23324/g.58544 Transcript_23324/m.58544 type:complete len:319 (+) Transcript_23324:302-1258(+)